MLITKLQCAILIQYHIVSICVEFLLEFCMRIAVLLICKYLEYLVLDVWILFFSQPPGYLKNSSWCLYLDLDMID